MKALALLLAVALSAACTSPRPAPARKDAVLSGDATARTASEAARAAQKKNDTGLIVASSEPATPAAEPAPTTRPSEPAVLVITLQNGVASIDGAPVPDLTTAVQTAAAKTPGLAVQIAADATTTYAQLVQTMDTVRAAGVVDIALAPATSPPPADQPTE